MLAAYMLLEIMMWREVQNGKLERTSDESVDVSNELGAAGGHVENPTFVCECRLRT
jgi:hypothetical protein